MKLVKEVEYTVSIKATLNEQGELKIALSATAPYGSRTATATVDGGFSEDVQEQVKTALEAALEERVQTALALADDHASAARVAAVALGEQL